MARSLCPPTWTTRQETARAIRSVGRNPRGLTRGETIQNSASPIRGEPVVAPVVLTVPDAILSKPFRKTVKEMM